MVDRIDLDTQISSTFHAADAPNLEKADSRADLERLLAQDARKIIITTIFKFAEAGGVLNDRDNIIVLVDEAHRSQEGDLGRKMRRALPNAFLFGLTGTPVNRADRNTFFAFGAEEDEYGYLSRYDFERLDPRRRDEGAALRAPAGGSAHRSGRQSRRPMYKELTGKGSPRRTSDTARAKTAAKHGDPRSSPRTESSADLRRHREALRGEGGAPNGFGAQVVTFDRESLCALQARSSTGTCLPEETSDIVMHRRTAVRDDYVALQARPRRGGEVSSSGSATRRTR